MTQMTEADIQSRIARLADLRAAIGQAIVGQGDVVEQLLIGLLESSVMVQSSDEQTPRH